MKPANQFIAITDSDLLSVFLGDDREAAHRAFRELVTRYERLVWTVCHRQLNNHSDIEDAFQTTFLRLATQAGKIKKPQALSSWLYGVALKTSIRIRRNRLIRQSDIEIDDDLLLIAPDDSPFDTITRQFRIESIDQQLSLLEEKYRTPLLLFYFAGLTTREIAHQLGISRSATEGRLRRGRSKLRVGLTSQGILMSPAILTNCMIPVLQSQPELVTITCDRCIATITGTAAATSTVATATLVTGSIDTGTKLMILKSLITTAIVAILAVGGLMHAPGVSTADAAGDSAVALTVLQEEGETAAELVADNEIVTPAESFHQHFGEMHGDLLQHLHDFIGRIHGHKSHASDE